ncbi:Carboxypeptidase regulatory-like domain-containing protein [Hymenobacter gelipurpurascens]|uniref:Carboxypeptidase regulatory-like domain-containing protein n=1 Tax=Hymenobacter gelipurpurascens TaxID=89968 RepID=A0A212UFC8_9BACT|nr:Ig-like domain-containing domain [Hymenobacter gelipurpurascens]SNC76959.1 Carboxypeptidase regulatory-like domain-containing protein [Hymenobacter gelipurpurascens]
MSVRASSFLLISAAAAGLSGCAAISSPQGGERDTIPPKLVSSEPANEARNVQGQSVRLVFSEQVQVKDLQKNLIIAPFIGDDNKYKVREERNAVTLLFDKPFEPNTTYSFNFGNSISDITESNPAPEAQVSFSTGAQLDSGSVRGTVTELLTGLPAAEASVVLYPEADTANIRRGRPYYLARTNKQGAFSLRYLKAGRYQLYALADKNQSNRYEEGERIAYLPDLFTVGGTGSDSLRLALTKPDSRRPLVTTQKPEPTQFRVAYNEGLQSVTVAPLGAAAPTPALQEAVQLTEKGRTVVLHRIPGLTEGRFLLASTDSSGNVGRDTVNVRFQGTAPARRGPGYGVEGNPRDVYRQGQVKFVFNEPIRLVAGKPIGTLIEDSLKRRPLRLPQDGSLSPERTVLSINLSTQARKTVTIILDSTMVQSVTDQPTGLKPLRLRLTDQSTTGTLSGSISTKYTSFQLQLLDANNQVIATLKSPKGTYRFDYLAPATYKMRVLIDTNKDGRWQGGDPQLRVPPEPIYFFPKTIQVRANFDIIESLSF